MRDQLKRLEELQQHDAKIQELENVLKAIPAKLEATRADLQRVEALLRGEQGQLAETERYYTDQKGALDDELVHVNESKQKLGKSTNAKEYAAAQRETEQRREDATNREGEIAKLVDAIKDKKKILEDRSRDVEALRASVEKDTQAADVKIAELQGQIAGLRKERDLVAKDIRPDVLKRYGNIRMRRGLAVVSVVSGTCQGCNMNIPPQLYNILQRGTSIETCPSCHRLIYWDELMRAEPQT